MSGLAPWIVRGAGVAIGVALVIGVLGFAWAAGPVLVLMFVADYLYHSLRFPDHPRASIARVLRAFAEVTSEPEGTKAL